MGDLGKICDAVFIEELFNRLHARASWLLAMVGVSDPIAQKMLLVAAFGVLLWIYARRVSTLGYRISVPVGVVVQAFTLGPMLTFLLVAIPAWVTFRHAAIASALLSVLPH
ncbi:MAG TPA: hypothetical protein VKU61_03340 [Candidatus Binatia bacterium]|nr:hypothetical protein [Candidatus Binatia bacterium]